MLYGSFINVHIAIWGGRHTTLFFFLFRNRRCMVLCNIQFILSECGYFVAGIMSNYVAHKLGPNCVQLNFIFHYKMY